MHGGHISGAGYLKLPETFGETYQKSKPSNSNGTLQVIFQGNFKHVILRNL